MNPTDPNTPQQQYQLPNQGVQVTNPLSVMQVGERNICQIRRHPVGMIGVYIGSGVLLVLLAILAFGVGPYFASDDNRSMITGVGALAFLIFTVLTIVFVFISNKVYWGNSWILTSDSLTQVLQRSLFDKQSSQLSLGNLEDVTATKDGILAHMFNFGELRVETAGERSKFVFLFCPNPDKYAQQILAAREDFEQGRGAIDDQRSYRGQGSYEQPGAPGQGYASNPVPPVYQNPDSGVNVNTQE